VLTKEALVFVNVTLNTFQIFRGNFRDY